MSIWRIVVKRCQLAGLDASKFGAHSLRSGFMTESGKQGTPLDVAMKFSGHKDVKTAMGYIQQGSLALLDAARLLENSRKKAM